jgi:hypothetical protein
MVEEGIYRNRVLSLPLVRVFNNKGWLVITNLSKKYAAHFSPEFILPFNNQTTAFSFTRHGNFMLFLTPFLVLGLASAYDRDKNYWFFLSWLLVAPIPSTLTAGHLNPNRCLIMLPALCYFAAKGIVNSYHLLQTKLDSKEVSKIFLAIVGVLFIANLSWYIHDWIIYFPEDSGHYWHGFYQQVSQKIWQARKQYNKVYFTNTDTQPYIFFAWYNQIDPQLMHRHTHNRDLSTLEGVRQIDNLYFWDVKKETIPCYLLEPNVLVVASANDDTLSNKKFPPHCTYQRKNRFHPGEVVLNAWESDLLTIKQKDQLGKLCQTD